MGQASGPHAPYALGAVSFAESSIFPIPPDVLLIPMVIAERLKAWWFAFLCTITSVLGGIAGYIIGYYLFAEVAEPILEFYGYGAKIDQFADQYNEWGAWIVFIAGVTPFPFKVVTIASGATSLNITVFIIASLLARGLRFFVVAGLLYFIGPPIRAFIEKRLGLVFTVFIIGLVGGFVMLRFLV